MKPTTKTKSKDFLIARQQAYQQTFNQENVFVKKVLEDLSKFCRENRTTFDPDPRIHAVLEGRREVLLRIQTHLKLSPQELLEVYGLNDL